MRVSEVAHLKVDDIDSTLRLIRVEQGKIERWHQTLKNHILLENYFLPSDLMVIIPENHWVENWTSPAIDALGEPDEEITIYGKPDPCNFEAMMRIRK